MKKIKNEIIVIGGDHYNALGVIRSLGENNINPIFILLKSNNAKPTTIYSKYIKETYVINFQESEIIDFLKNNYNDEKEKPIIIPTGDPICTILDKNYNLLSKKYILPNIAEKQGLISKYMNKSFQHDLCKKNDVLIAKTKVINLNDNYKSEVKNINKKTIIKPKISSDGQKSDIIIANNNRELIAGLDIFKSKKYDDVLLQEYLDYDTEYAMMGISYKGKIIIPGINDNIYIYPSNKGNTSYSEMFPLKDFKYDISKIIKMLEKINYTGLFEVEMFKVDDKIYFNEVNFRNSANLYAYMGNNVNYIYIYILLLLKKSLKEEKIFVDKHYYFSVDMLHLKNAGEGVISLRQAIKHIKNSTRLMYNRKDPKPYRMKILFAIFRRIFGNEK